MFSFSINHKNYSNILQYVLIFNKKSLKTITYCEILEKFFMIYQNENVLLLYYVVYSCNKPLENKVQPGR